MLITLEQSIVSVYWTCGNREVKVEAEVEIDVEVEVDRASFIKFGDFELFVVRLNWS